MRFELITLFPEMFIPILESGVIGRAIKKGLIEVNSCSDGKPLCNSRNHPTAKNHITISLGLRRDIARIG